MANEKRLIDANALLKEVESYTQFIVDVNHNRDMFYHGSGWNGALVAARVSIKEAPTVDAVEVVHGRKAESAISKTGLMCTACYSDIDRDAVFCKYCGAKMDGDGNGT